MANYVSNHTGAQIDAAVENVGVLDGKVTTLSEEMAEQNAKSEDVVTPEMYGAVGDGVADDTNAIQQAINSGKIVRFGYRKTYLVTSSIMIGVSTYKMLCGNFSFIKLADGVDDNVITVAGGTNNLVIERLFVVGNEENKNGILLQGMTYLMRFYQVSCKNNGLNGLKIEGNSFANQFVECEFTQNGENGFDAAFEETTTTHSLATTDFHMSRFTRNGNAGLRVNSSVVKLYGGWFEGNNVGIVFSAEHYDAGSTSLFGVDIEGNHLYAIKFVKASGRVMDGYHIVGAQVCSFDESGALFYYDFPDYNVITDVTIDTACYPKGGFITDSASNIFIYAKDYPTKGLSSNTKIRIMFNVTSDYVNDSNEVQKYVIGAKPVLIDTSSGIKYTIDPGECVTIKFNSAAFAASIKCNSTGSLVMYAPIVISGKTIGFNRYEAEATETDNVYKFSPNTDTNLVMLVNNGDSSVEVSNILWTGRLPKY